MDGVIISSRLFVELVRDLLEKGHRVRFRAQGTSMLPTIAHGDLITVGSVNPATVRRGEIILYHHRQRPIVHRVADVCRTVENRIAVVLRGDGKGGDDAPVDSSQILGRVVEVERRSRSLTAQFRDAAVACLSRVGGLREAFE